ncbi:hypothetical protein PI23P_11287 [Polaribacter irgensii 23-P]|uniref:Uncharacterized protein n=1 Tax=Polaribacter irgensii 23-P TaxID=313594 RepID=A4C1B0_9FLAO|nr:hypothetical protein PI23P_11287 [Polaribacter irgensii 23-P]
MCTEKLSNKYKRMKSAQRGTFYVPFGNENKKPISFKIAPYKYA